MKWLERNDIAKKCKARGNKYQFGVRVSRNIDDAYLLDAQNINTF